MKYLINGAFVIATVLFVVGQFLEIGMAGEMLALATALVFGAVAFTGGIVASCRALTGVDTGIASGAPTAETGEAGE